MRCRAPPWLTLILAIYLRRDSTDLFSRISSLAIKSAMWLQHCCLTLLRVSLWGKADTPGSRSSLKDSDTHKIISPMKCPKLSENSLSNTTNSSKKQLLAQLSGSALISRRRLLLYKNTLCRKCKNQKGIQTVFKNSTTCKGKRTTLSTEWCLFFINCDFR